MLFPALDFRKHLASAVSLVTIDTGGERFGFFLPSIDVPEGQTAHFHTVGVYKMFSAQTRSRIGRQPGGASNWVERRRP